MTLNVCITARKRSLGQGNVFTPVCQSFCSQGGVCPTPLDADPPDADPSGYRHLVPWMQTLPGIRSTCGRYDPPLDAPGYGQHADGTIPPGCPGIRSTFGRYASYWNAFLFSSVFPRYSQWPRSSSSLNSSGHKDVLTFYLAGVESYR